jgi:hypothetical protein
MRQSIENSSAIGANLAQGFDTERQRIGADFVTHEEPAALIVRVVARFGDPAVVGGQKLLTLATMPTRSGQAITSRKVRMRGNSRTSQRRPF